MATERIRNDRKLCGLCNTYIYEIHYRAHVAECGLVDNNDEIQEAPKVCGLCGRQVQDLALHYQTCTGGYSTTNQMYKNKRNLSTPSDYQYAKANVQIKKSTKECAICSKIIDEADFADHVDRCITSSLARPSTTTNTKECPICSKTITETDYIDHLDKCTTMSSVQPTRTANAKECIICSKIIAEANYVEHVNACLSKSSSSSSSKLPTKQNQNSCFICSSPVDLSKSSSHTIPCQARHIYCLKCLRDSMNKYIQSNTVPVCHSTFCDYELCRYDIACLPLEADIIKRLLTCVKSVQRAQCPICSFYVDFNTMQDLENHVVVCNPENLIPCEYCHCLYNIHRLDNHSQQCRSLPRSQQRQALIDFLLPRTKYPLTAQQIRFFLEHRKDHMSLDPHSIINALAVYGSTFPFEIPTRDCDICTEARTYDDIFVFGCQDNHKLCYKCFEDSCEAKMNNNEVLTCPVCTYQLQDGEIKQLRIPMDRKTKLLEYQAQKTFNAYTGNTKGVIKCPNQGCKWVAEAWNPNDRFQVECRICHYQFCSLCNQQYHFRTTCQQVLEITQRWFFWCNTERGNYWQARAQQDANFRAQLNEYEQQKQANIQRNEELHQRYNELLADENYKAQNCRLCPKCHRVVQHLSGCDQMVCGRNYHGGDQQSGCGQGFNWSQALPYTPITNTGPEQVRNDLPPPEQQKAIIHEGVRCDSCHNDIQGIRFDCIHCASLTFCERCEQRCTLEHSNEIRDQQKQQHVFQLITRPLNFNNQ